MGDLPVAAESSATTGPAQPVQPAQVSPAVEVAGGSFAAAAEQARQLVLASRQVIAQEQGNAV